MNRSMSNSTKKSFIRYLTAAFLIILIDRISKAVIIHTPSCRVTQWLTFSPMLNRGFAWSIFAAEDSVTFIIVSLTATIFFLFFSCYSIYRYASHPQTTSLWGEVLIISGALSNLMDRYIYKGVVDFIVISCGSLSWPSFNIADAAICIGALLMFIQIMKEQ